MGEQQFDQNQGSGQGRARKRFSFTPKLLIIAVIVILAIITLSTGFFVVDQTEQAVILRWGKYLLLMQRGCSVVYFGEELGMQSKDFPHKEIQDPLGKRYWPIMKGRDAERRPMQWDYSENMGFSGAKPWLEPNYTKNWRHLTVESEKTDRSSMLALYRSLIALRKSRSEISESDAVFCTGVPSDVIAYYFLKDRRCTLVLLNMGRKQRTFKLDAVVPGVSDLNVALNTYSRVNSYVKDGCISVPAGLGVVLTN